MSAHLIGCARGIWATGGVNSATRRGWAAMLGALLIMGMAGLFSAGASELPPGFVEEKLVDHIDSATALAVARDGRIFFAEQTGALRVWKGGGLLPTPALDLGSRLDTYWERGLIGVTLHPEFPKVPQLFVMYVAKAPFVHHVVSRFTMNGDLADPASEVILLEGDDQGKFGGDVPAGHQGGPLCFGADGKLYIGLGEQTARPLSQSLNALQGKILRINPDGSIPEDNPFFSQTTGKYRSIWAIGMRNPFGLAVQAETGRMFASDVGESSWEEVDMIIRGENYGWPEAEGMSKNPRFQNPIYTYPPVIGRCIAGGIFYPWAPPPGAAEAAGFFPKEWWGTYFFCDWSAGWIKAVDPDAPQSVASFGSGFANPVAIELAPGGSLIVLNRGTIWRDPKKFQPNTGSLVRIRYAGAGAAAAPRAEPFSASLLGTGVFASLAPLTPREEFVPFVINLPPWQPGVFARRWISIPAGANIHFSAAERMGISQGRGGDRTLRSGTWRLERGPSVRDAHPLVYRATDGARRRVSLEKRRRRSHADPRGANRLTARRGEPPLVFAGTGGATELGHGGRRFSDAAQCAAAQLRSAGSRLGEDGESNRTLERAPVVRARGFGGDSRDAAALVAAGFERRAGRATRSLLSRCKLRGVPSSGRFGAEQHRCAF